MYFVMNDVEQEFYIENHRIKGKFIWGFIYSHSKINKNIENAKNAETYSPSLTQKRRGTAGIYLTFCVREIGLAQ